MAIWAPSGAGKSVLLAQLAGLLPVPAGRLELDGRRMQEQDWPVMRARMAWMSQQPHIFAGSVPRNVHLGREGPAAVQHALHQAGLGKAFTQRYSTSLGSRAGPVWW